MMAKPATSRFTLDADLHPGYGLRRLRGVGGFGEVWEAEKQTGGDVALKFLPCTGARGGAAQELRSIQIVQRLSHPNLIEIDRVWCAGAYLMVAMDLADGSLTDLLDVYESELGTALPPEHLLPYLAQAAKALDFLNNRQHLIQNQQVTIQHGDVNPSNMLVFGPTIKLSDFSLTTTLTGTQKIHRRAGTMAYAAPEVFQGRLTNRTDQYALAVSYCMMRGGCLPFDDTPKDFQSPYTRPCPDLSMLPIAERPAVARALAPKTEDRWASCGDMIKELCKRTSVNLTPSSPWLRRS
jgi:serine/threonine-protein kinase